jgi:hypothetical protein
MCRLSPPLPEAHVRRVALGIGRTASATPTGAFVGAAVAVGCITGAATTAAPAVVAAAAATAATAGVIMATAAVIADTACSPAAQRS